jgi:hypothetical protein
MAGTRRLPEREKWQLYLQVRRYPADEFASVWLAYRTPETGGGALLFGEMSAMAVDQVVGWLAEKLGLPVEEEQAPLDPPAAISTPAVTDTPTPFVTEDRSSVTAVTANRNACAYCGGPLVGRADARYCKTACRVAGHRRRRAAAEVSGRGRG